MPSWNELLAELVSQGSDQAAGNWMQERLSKSLEEISRIRGDRQVLLYGSAFLQKPQVPAMNISISAEDINGLMSTIYGMDWSKGLTLILHTPGGAINAAESIVDYLRSKFSDIEVIVPAFAMSAGTMIALASDRIIMGRPSQLGPIDPQMPVNGRSVSAQAIVDQFDKAKAEILDNRLLANAWAPVLQSLGPALVVEARNALDYGESMVAQWLERYMLAGQASAASSAAAIAHHFNDAGKHKSHGRRIGIDEAIAQGLIVEALEADQALQEEVLTAYHLMTLTFEQSLATKVMAASTGRNWLKNHGEPPPPQAPAQGGQSPQQPARAPSPAPAGNRAARRKQARGGGNGRS